jgi:hypothetical protein
MPDALLSLVSNELGLFRELQHQQPQMFPNCNQAPHLYPIPFFGDIRRAKILTVSLNPSWTEFRPARQWLANLDAPALTTRLLHYFDLPFPRCHTWFAQWEKALLYLGCSYEQDAAHVDLSPCPTLRPIDIPDIHDPRRIKIAELVLGNLNHLECVLKFCESVKLLVVVDYAFQYGEGNTLGVFRTIQEHVGSVARLIIDSQSPPVLRGNGLADLGDWLFLNRHHLRRYLERGRNLNFT